VRRDTSRVDVAVAAFVALAVLPLGCGQPQRSPSASDDVPVRVSASVASSEVAPGVPFDLTVEVDRRQDALFTLPDLGEKVSGLVVMGHETSAAETVAGRVLTTETWTLKAPRSGTYLIPAAEAPWKAGEQVGTAGSGPILLEAKRPEAGEAAQEAELRDVRGPSRLDRNWAPLVAAVAALLAAAAGLVLWLRARRRRRPPAPPPTPEEEALAALAALLRPQSLEAADAGPFAFSVSAILRRYLESRFGFRAFRMTTPEVLRAMPEELASQRSVESAIRELLEASDQVKFARRPVTQAELRGWVERARAVVEQSRPRDPAGEAAPGGSAAGTASASRGGRTR
jgi:hypothetical protein